MGGWIDRPALVKSNGSSGSPKSSEVLDKLSDYNFSRRILFYGLSCFVIYGLIIVLQQAIPLVKRPSVRVNSVDCAKGSQFKSEVLLLLHVARYTAMS